MQRTRDKMGGECIGMELSRVWPGLSLYGNRVNFVFCNCLALRGRSWLGPKSFPTQRRLSSN